MFRVKICGITNPSDALMAADAGADAIGVNFYTESPRGVAVETATQIVDAVEGRLAAVGVFVDHDAQRINQIAQEVGLDWVQLHGDHTSDEFGQVDATFKTIRVHRLRLIDMPSIASDLARCRAAGRAADAVLVDALQPGAYGGTGHQLDWQALENYQQSLQATPLVLAGGLNPENVAEAVRTVRPAAVDVASGVEQSPGVKDQQRVADFVRHARATLGS